MPAPMQRSMALAVGLLVLAQAVSGSRIRHPGSGQRNRSLGFVAGNTSLRGLPKYGEAACPCVGIDGLSGETTIGFGGDAKVAYPADLGARCEAWDDGLVPEYCEEGGDPGKGNSWCKERWCFVDPCNCNLDVLPKPSTYLTRAEFKGRPIYFSYATCGVPDTWSGSHDTKVAKELVKSLCKEPAEEAEWGKEDCRCVGIADQPGRTDVTIGGKVVGYAADAGAKCRAWDLERHPDCGGEGKKPDWCGKSWCYVDPCSCKLNTPPKKSSYLPGATFRGKPLYYSYATCGSTDTWAKGKVVISAPPSVCESEPGPGAEYNNSEYAKDWHDEWKNGDFPDWRRTTRGAAGAAGGA